jgi:hypothetical protein
MRVVGRQASRLRVMSPTRSVLVMQSIWGSTIEAQ